MEAGSVWNGKLKRIELNSGKLYSVLEKKRDEDGWGWIMYDEYVTMFSFLFYYQKS
jgi:hypothetical protein